MEDVKTNSPMELADFEKLVAIDPDAIDKLNLAPDEAVEIKAGEEVIGYVQDKEYEAAGQ